ncbi:ATP-binding cassette domain-containing protein [Arthrobacter sp. W4I7]|uniref:ATP-binding cassette domain-containing protein n=1 Tax=Arthrobacter sp. W4I7 TaxID=3042296 RepID=UPI00277E9BEB|nr:ATP-binding cassette domain-containing protein [Arthrobacter sp. W4I7]MDQ0693081.1 ABC-type oligopeptide transport system ATPase subunit [Arthrobacter sp. W4I7]
MSTNPSTNVSPLLEVTDLAVDYRNGRRSFRAVKGVSFTLECGRTLGLVGESGSGKSTIGRAILGLAPVSSGSVRFRGEELATMKRARRRELSNQIQVIFQDPYSSLDITKTIGYTLAEPLNHHERLTREQTLKRIREMVRRVGLPEESIHRYPAQFSGGQRQRIAIARALIGNPKFVVCDEPVSALDLSIQAEVMNLLAELQKSMGLALLFISHDLSVVRHISDDLVVLKNGLAVEHGRADDIYANAEHPYTRSLLAASPVPDPQAQAERRRARQAAAIGSHARTPSLERI